MLSYAIVETGFGFVGIGGSKAGLRLVTLPGPSTDSVLPRIETLGEGATESASAFGNLPSQLRRYFEGETVTFTDELDFGGATDFQAAVWKATRSISRGETRSYAWVANEVGRPGASRAVGNALGRNPLAIIVPCHRVITSDGRLGGFGGGLDMKERLLSLEAPHHQPD